MVYCVLKNKVLKFYADGAKQQDLRGVIDFDVLKCTIEKEYNVIQATIKAKCQAKFKIEVDSIGTKFIFEAQDVLTL